VSVRVGDYMVLEVEHLDLSSTVGEAIDKLLRSRHHGMPVTDRDGRLVGFVSAKELLRKAGERGTYLGAIIRPGTYTATPDMALDDVARIMFRYGLRDLPIIDSDGKLCGVVSNLDIVRSHFERASPAKAETLRKLLQERYDLPFAFRRGRVTIGRLKPTQWKVYLDELEGRGYELERGFAEPLLVVQKGEKEILVDGHHRALAARQMGLTQLQAFILTCEKPHEFAQLETGFERVARDHGLESLDDIRIEKAAHHPLMEVTTQLLRRYETQELPSPEAGSERAASPRPSETEVRTEGA
jgi:IMP dehydrogenase